jgi:AraC family transcriptional regulator
VPVQDGGESRQSYIVFPRSNFPNINQYVLQNRIERAKKLICVSANPNLTEIGLQVGFYDQAHFTKAFKQFVGVSPKAFAKQIAN